MRKGSEGMKLEKLPVFVATARGVFVPFRVQQSRAVGSSELQN